MEETLYVDSEIRLGDVVLGATPAVGAPLRSESYLAVYDELLLATGNSEENCGPRSAFLTVRAHPDVEPEQLAPIPYWATQAMFWVRWEPWHPEG